MKKRHNRNGPVPGKSEPPTGRIVNRTQLCNLVDAVRERKIVAFDTEFHSDTFYYPRLYLMQVAIPAENGGAIETYIIDPLEVEDLSPFAEVLTDPSIESVVHAGTIDVEILANDFGYVPANIFDTQIAAGFVSQTFPMGLSRLLEASLGITLAKGQTLSNWSQRPLSPKQLHYAIEDVRYLIQLRDNLKKELVDAGRLPWFQTEIAKKYEESRFARSPELAYRKFSGWNRLQPNKRACLRDLAAFRENTAAELDRPVRRVLDDQLIMDLARQCPRSIAELKEHRRITNKHVQAYGEQLIQCIETGHANPMTGDEFNVRNSLSPAQKSRLTALTMITRIACDQAGVSFDLVAPKNALTEVVHANNTSSKNIQKELGGWRGQLLGDTLSGFMNGKVGLAYDTEDQAVKLIKLD